MVECLAANCFRSAATAHIEAMHRITLLESCLSEALSVSCRARSFKAVHENELGVRIFRTLGMHQHLHARFCFVELFFDWESNRVCFSRPVISGDGQQMRVLEDRNERAQALILAKTTGAPE